MGVSCDDVSRHSIYFSYLHKKHLRFSYREGNERAVFILYVLYKKNVTYCFPLHKMQIISMNIQKLIVSNDNFEALYDVPRNGFIRYVPTHPKYGFGLSYFNYIRIPEYPLEFFIFILDQYFLKYPNARLQAEYLLEFSLFALEDRLADREMILYLSDGKNQIFNHPKGKEYIFYPFDG
jgi:hypothetical protein